MENIAKSTSYGCYLDCDFETAKYPDDKTHIVGLLAEYVYDLEQRILHYDERYIKLWNEIETLRECVSKEFDKEQKISDLEAKLAESEKSKESYRLQNEHHHLQLLQFYSRLGVEAFGADIHEKALETLMIMKEQLAEKDLAIENWQTMYESIVQTCHNDKEEIERLNKQLATQENTITNIIEDNRASQEWYKKQLEEKEKENTKLKEVVDCVDKLKQFNADMKDYALVNRDVADEIYCEQQDKISFAVEQLEQLKKLCQEKFNWWENSEWEGNIYDKSDVSNAYFDIEANIDNQIKQLKEGK